MKKIVLSVGMLFSFYFSNAQDFKLKNEFAKQRSENEKKLDAFFNKNSRYSIEEKDSLKSNLAGFAGGMPFFYTTEETRANATSNIDELQSGSVTGAAAVTGNGIKITVFDSGRPQDNHEQIAGRAVYKEAATTTRYTHSTSVTNVLIGNGLATGNFTSGGQSYSKANAKGVLPLGTTDNYSFSATALGTNFEKLVSIPNINISNHSYGTNVGWTYVSTANPPYYPVVGWYWYANYDLNALDTYSGAYYENDYNFDKIVYSNPQQIIVKSTGNYYGGGPTGTEAKYKFKNGAYVPFEDGDVIPAANCSLGYNCIGFGSLAKNIITVGAVNQLTTPNNKYTQATDVVKGSFSSAGPRKDGAVKPDLTAVGVNMVMASYIGNNTIIAYTATFGTSFATPIVSGIAGALTQIQRNMSGNNDFIFNADEMKVLLTHTANEAGRPGPDVWYGWGLVDGKKAAQVLVNRLTEDAYFQKDNLKSNVSFTKEIKATGTEPLKVSISWVDPAITPFTTDIDLQQNHTSRIVNDLDLRVVEIGSGTIYYPWKLDIADPNANAIKGDNTVDNVEQIIIDSPVADGVYRVEVTNKNTLVNQEGNAATQDFAWVATGTKKITLASDNLIKEDIKIYPTKTKGMVNVSSPTDIERIAVFDMNGKLIHENSKISKSQTIDLNKFPSSVYIINVKTKTGTISKKIIKE